MTAIAGIIGLGGYVPDRAAVARMRNILTKFGRDAQHEVWDGSAVMLRTLLRSTPEDIFDRQPLRHAPSRTLLAFDGRIDNREDLGRELDIAPRRLGRLSDADLVLEAVLRWGNRAPEHFVGDFAMAVWDAAGRALWLARDPLGIRPLFWHRQEQFLAFATQPSALFAIDGVVKELDPETLHDHLALIPNKEERSFFRGMQRIMPGHVVTLSAQAGQRHRNHRYHDFWPKKTIWLPNDEAYVSAFREELERAVRCRLRTQGTVASHLSSGMDSTTVTSVAARLLARDGKSLHAVTAAPREGFDGSVMRGWHADEATNAARVAARHQNVRHTLYRHASTAHLEGLDEILEALDRPPLNLCNMGWADGISRLLASEGHGVVLTGLFGDLSISYTGQERLPSLFLTGRWLTLHKELRALTKRYRRRYRWWFIEKVLQPFMPAPLWRMWKARQGEIWGDVTTYTALHPSFVSAMGTQDRARRAGRDLAYRRPWDSRQMRIQGLEWLDYGEYSLLEDLRGLQARHPLGDQRLLSFLLAVPDEQFFRDGQHQRILRNAMANILPEAVLAIRTRGQQAPDWYEALLASTDVLREEVARWATADDLGDALDLQGLADDLAGVKDIDGSSLEDFKRYRLRVLRGVSVGRFMALHSAGN